MARPSITGYRYVCDDESKATTNTEMNARSTEARDKNIKLT
jgi:hypothetical protein